jgi:hypothetical protein
MIAPIKHLLAVADEVCVDLYCVFQEFVHEYRDAWGRPAQPPLIIRSGCVEFACAGVDHLISSEDAVNLSLLAYRVLIPYLAVEKSHLLRLAYLVLVHPSKN